MNGLDDTLEKQLREMPTFELDAANAAAIEKSLSHFAERVSVRKRNENHRKFRVWSSVATASLAVVIAGGIFFEVNRSTRVTPRNEPKQSQVNTATQTNLKTQLGFQPMLPSNLPAPLHVQSTEMDIYTHWVTYWHPYTNATNVHEFICSISAEKGVFDQNPDAFITEQTASEVEVQGVFLPHNVGIKGESVQINGQTFGKFFSRGQTTPTLYTVRDGIYYSITGDGISLSQEANILNSLNKPTNTVPDSVVIKDRSLNAANNVGFKVILPTWVPNGYKLFEPAIFAENESLSNGQHVRQFTVSYGSGPSIDIHETDTSVPTVPVPTDAQEEIIGGQKVYFYTTNTTNHITHIVEYDYNADWTDPRTNVQFHVEAFNTTGHISITESMLHRVVSSMIH